MCQFCHLQFKRPVWLMLTWVGVMFMLLVAACVPAGVNVTRVANLAQTTQLDIADLATAPQAVGTPLFSTTDATTIQQVVRLLDTTLPLGPMAECLGQYQLSFHLSSGEVQQFEYFCRGGASFLRGDQAFWSNQQVQPPAAFDDLIKALLPTR